jgi:hypothetical protein
MECVGHPEVTLTVHPRRSIGSAGRAEKPAVDPPTLPVCSASAGTARSSDAV